MKQIGELSLLRGSRLEIVSNVVVNHPKLSDIEEIGLDRYRLYVSLLTCGRFEYADILFCENNIWYEDIESDWKLFLNMCFAQQKEVQIIFEDKNLVTNGVAISDIYRDSLNFFLELSGEYIIALIEKGNVQQTVLYNSNADKEGVYHITNDNIVIGELVYNKLADFLRKINWLNRDFDFLKGGTKYAKKFMLKHDYSERKVRRKQYITFDTIVSFLMCKLSDPNTVWSLPIYAIYNLYYRFNKINNYQDMLNKMNAGCIDTKKTHINWEKINWASSID